MDAMSTGTAASPKSAHEIETMRQTLMKKGPPALEEAENLTNRKDLIDSKDVRKALRKLQEEIATQRRAEERLARGNKPNGNDEAQNGQRPLAEVIQNLVDFSKFPNTQEVMTQISQPDLPSLITALLKSGRSYIDAIGASAIAKAQTIVGEARTLVDKVTQNDDRVHKILENKGVLSILANTEKRLRYKIQASQID